MIENEIVSILINHSGDNRVKHFRLHTFGIEKNYCKNKDYNLNHHIYTNISSCWVINA